MMLADRSAAVSRNTWSGVASVSYAPWWASEG